MSVPVGPSPPSGPSSMNEPTSSKQPVSSRSSLRVDHFYSINGMLRASVLRFIWHVLNGAQIVVKTVVSVLFYPFLNHYEVKISPNKLNSILAYMKQEDVSQEEKFSALERNVRLAVRSKGDISSVKKIIKTFAEEAKKTFEKIANCVVRSQQIDMDTITGSPDRYVLSCIQNGQTTIAQFYHAMNFYLIENVDIEEQFAILESQLQRAEFLTGEIPNTQKLFLAFAQINPLAFKEIASCLAEVNGAIQTVEASPIEEVAKKWIDDTNQFDPIKMREALDLRVIKIFAEKVKEDDLYDQPYSLYQFFINKEANGDQEVSEESRDFMARSLLEILSSLFPKLMRDLSFEMIKIDEKNNGVADLFPRAKKDELWGKPNFPSERYVLSWMREKRKFDRRIMIDAFLGYQRKVFFTAIVEKDKTPSARLEVFDHALKRVPRTQISKTQLSSLISTFTKDLCNKQLTEKFVCFVLDVDRHKAKTAGAKRFIPELTDGTDGLEAIIRVADEVVREDNDTVVAFIGLLRLSVSYTQRKQFEEEMSDKNMEFSDQIESLLILSRFALLSNQDRDHEFKKNMVLQLVKTSPESFSQLVFHIIEESEDTKTLPVVRKLAENAEKHESYPDQVDKRNKEIYEQSGILGYWQKVPVPLNEEQRRKAKLHAYLQVFTKHFADNRETDLDWLYIGMRTYLEK